MGGPHWADEARSRKTSGLLLEEPASCPQRPGLIEINNKTESRYLENLKYMYKDLVNPISNHNGNEMTMIEAL